MTKPNIYDESYRLSINEIKVQLEPTFKVIKNGRNLKDREKDLLRALVWYAATNKYDDLLQYKKEEILTVLNNYRGLVEQTRYMYNDFSKRLPYIQVIEMSKEEDVLDEFIISELISNLEIS